MAVYDPEPEEDTGLAAEEGQESEKKPKGLTSEEIAQRESEIGDRYNSFGGENKRRFDQALGRHAKTRNASLAADAQESRDLKNRVAATAAGLSAADQENLFKKENQKGLRGRLSNWRRNRRMFLIGGGVAGLLVAVAFGLFNFLNVFRLDQILNSLDVKTFARFNASFDRRSDSWFKSYLQLRLTEWGGDYANPGEENLYFRSRRVDTDHPIRDWYRTMRTSTFEKDLFEKHGIQFTSIVTPDGKIRTGKITINDREIPFDVLNRDGVDIDKLATGDLNQLNIVNPFIDDFIDAEIFDSDKSARIAIKRAVNDNTRSYQVFRRRHLRKDIANMTGVREWRMFEKTRDKIDNAKISVQRKIINRIFSGDSSSTRFINCLLGGDGCPKTSDPVDPENRSTALPTGELDPEDERVGQPFDDNGNPQVDDNGNPLSGNTDGITREVTEAVSETVQESSTEVLQSANLTKRLIQNIGAAVAKVSSPAAVLEWFQRIAAIDGLFRGGENSTIVRLVKNARVVQLVGMYTVTGIARDQIKSGELVGDELNGFFDMTKNFSDSEAWGAVGSTYDTTKASAQDVNDVAKEAYCRSDYDRKFEQYSHYCDSWKPNGGGTASDLSETYKNTIGWLLGPIADAVNGITGLPIIGPIINKVTDIVGSVLNLFSDAFMASLRAIGLEDNVQSIMGSALTWLLNFVGAAPFTDPETPGFAAWIVGGSSASAEATTRWSGGAASTPTSYQYSKTLANAYDAERQANMSFTEKYLSTQNPESLTSTVALAASNVTAGENLFSKIAGAFTNLPSSIMSSLSPRAKAANRELAVLAGVDMYDIPESCMTLDPLDPDYLSKVTNASIPNLSYSLVNNAETFWQAVYTNPQPQVGENREAIYNCALLDTRVRGSLGYAYGYTSDGGLEDGASASTGGTTAVVQFDGDPFSSSANVACAAGTKDLGVKPGFNNGSPTSLRLCAISEVTSSSLESTPGSKYYIEGADGKLIVNSRVSGAVLAMITAAKGDGVPIAASDGFRTKEHQQEVWDSNPDPRYVDQPGFSSHQSGAAIDFNAGGISGGDTCAQRARAPANAVWNWLYTNAEQYGYRQLASESQHWDPSNTSEMCGTGE